MMGSRKGFPCALENVDDKPFNSIGGGRVYWALTSGTERPDETIIDNSRIIAKNVFTVNSLSRGDFSSIGDLLATFTLKEASI